MGQPHANVCLDYIPILKYIILKFFHLILTLGIIGEHSEQVAWDLFPSSTWWKRKDMKSTAVSNDLTQKYFE